MSLVRKLLPRRSTHAAGAVQRLAAVDFTRRNPIVVIPGILGSRLIAAETSADLWAGDREGFARPDSDDQMRLLTGPMEIGTPLHKLGTLVTSDGAVGSVEAHIAGISLRIKAYGDLLSALGVSSYTDTHARRGIETRPAVAFEFSYDWRRSLDESARLLHEFLLRAARFVSVQRGLGWAPRFDIVAHSMGGLLLRYYLRYGTRPLALDDRALDGSPVACTWAGAEMVERAIVVASPAGGSVMSAMRILTGLAGNPVHPGYDPAVPGSMPSLYQLLPRQANRPVVGPDGTDIDLLDLDTWVARGWGLASEAIEPTLVRLLPGADSPGARRALALDHLQKCLCSARAFQQAMDRQVPPKPSHLRIHYMLSSEKPTAVRAVAIDGGKEPLRIVEYGPGDATVPAASALLDRRVAPDEGPVDSPLQWDSVTLVPGDHLGLTREPAFVDNLVFRLLDDP